jgi:hypothetical protein
MQILHGENLVKELRRLADNVEERLWIAVPYIGNPVAMRKILGRRWFDSPSVSVKLLTDTSDLAYIDAKTIQYFHKKGEVRTLTGLHAKIYIIDNDCLITSANLTGTAFSKRHEIGILCDSSEAKKVITTFDTWWKMSKNVESHEPADTSPIVKRPPKEYTGEEYTTVLLPALFNLPNDPGSFGNVDNSNEEDTIEQEERYYIVNTNFRYSTTDYKDMLSEEKASAYGSRSNSIYNISNGDSVFLYHKRVGIIAYGQAIDDAKPNPNNENDDEVYIQLQFDWKVDPINERGKAVKISEINRELGTGHSFPQTVFLIDEEVAAIIKKLALEKTGE